MILPIQSQPVLRNVSTAKVGGNIAGVTQSGSWDCYLIRDNSYQGSVSIWWGDIEANAVWACNSWRSGCGNQGGCRAVWVGP